VSVSIEELHKVVERRLAEAEERMAGSSKELDYKYYEGQLHVLEIILEHLENLE